MSGTYIVRPKLTGDAEQTGAEGAQGTIVRAATAAKAKEEGAAKLKLPISRLEVIEYDGGGGSVIGALPGETIDPEELKDVFNQGASIVPGSWEGA